MNPVNEVKANDHGNFEVPATEAVSEFRDFQGADDPFSLFESWLAEAGSSELNDANAMSLATVDQRGMPNVRTVLLKGIDEAGYPDRGFVFYTNLGSAKGQELSAHGRAALLFHWKSLRRQVRVRGIVTPVEPDEADAYFASRPRGSQIGAWASDQSRYLTSRESLEQRVADIDARFAGTEVRRPPYWSGFRLTPLEIEFWHDRPYRLHDRLVFRRPQTREPWHKQRLFP
jgi:pyridoxamine 5'-phosphate oxidase